MYHEKPAILLTGATGFLGRCLYKVMHDDFVVTTMGRDASNEVVADLTTHIPNMTTTFQAVVHTAGKAHLYPKTEAEKRAFYQVNVEGTRRLLSALEASPPACFVFISSVAVYGLESGENIHENTPLDGKSPYAESKIQAEELVRNWCVKHGVRYLILRLPLIVGHNAPGNLGKMASSMQSGRYLRIAKGVARKSAVLATDVARLISDQVRILAGPSGIYHLTDGIHPSFFELEEALRQYYHLKPFYVIPRWLGYLIGRMGDAIPIFPINTATFRKITNTFTFSDEKARQELQWLPSPVLSIYTTPD
jgi:nucleoside-diphosphate-sugar epimerase